MSFELGMLSRLSRMASRKCSSGDATRSEIDILRLANRLFRIATGTFHGQGRAEIRKRHRGQAQRGDERAVFETGDAHGDYIGKASGGAIGGALRLGELAAVWIFRVVRDVDFGRSVLKLVAVYDGRY